MKMCPAAGSLKRSEVRGKGLGEALVAYLGSFVHHRLECLICELPRTVLLRSESNPRVRAVGRLQPEYRWSENETRRQPSKKGTRSSATVQRPKSLRFGMFLTRPNESPPGVPALSLTHTSNTCPSARILCLRR